MDPRKGPKCGPGTGIPAAALPAVGSLRYILCFSLCYIHEFDTQGFRPKRDSRRKRTTSTIRESRSGSHTKEETRTETRTKTRQTTMHTAHHRTGVKQRGTSSGPPVQQERGEQAKPRVGASSGGMTLGGKDV